MSDVVWDTFLSRLPSNGLARYEHMSLDGDKLTKALQEETQSSNRYRREAVQLAKDLRATKHQLEEETSQLEEAKKQMDFLEKKVQSLSKEVKLHHESELDALKELQDYRGQANFGLKRIRVRFSSGCVRFCLFTESTVP